MSEPFLWGCLPSVLVVLFFLIRNGLKEYKAGKVVDKRMKTQFGSRAEYYMTIRYEGGVKEVNVDYDAYNDFKVGDKIVILK